MSNQTFQDQQLECVECGQNFEFLADDQEFYASKGYSSPKRCPECRQARKARSGQRGGQRERVQYEVTCAECGCQTTVPFKPSNDRPVYCSDCYRRG